MSAAALPTPSRAWRQRLLAAARVLRRIIGVPDYEAYVAHHTRTHPGTVPLDRDTFVRQCQEARYSRPGSRCC
jgi:uncharacterized short protein YbdD (DUF466 family)